MQPRSVGYAMAIMGITGITLQLLIYPPIHGRLGTLKCYRVFSLLFPLAYTISPFLAAIPAGDNNAAATTTNSILLWLAITLVLLIHVMGRIFVMPASITLLNNCTPHPSTLGTVHGIGQTISAAFRTIGPVLAGYLYAVGNSNGVVGLVWWLMCVVAAVAWLVSLFVQEGSGHEIILPSEDDRIVVEM
jgi:hypothetical protein